MEEQWLLLHTDFRKNFYSHISFILTFLLFSHFFLFLTTNSTIKDADEILVLDSGKIVEHGTHDQLIANKGIYFTLQARQAKQINMKNYHH